MGAFYKAEALGALARAKILTKILAKILTKILTKIFTKVLTKGLAKGLINRLRSTRKVLYYKRRVYTVKK